MIEAQAHRLLREKYQNPCESREHNPDSAIRPVTVCLRTMKSCVAKRCGAQNFYRLVSR